MKRSYAQLITLYKPLSLQLQVSYDLSFSLPKRTELVNVVDVPHIRRMQNHKILKKQPLSFAPMFI